MIPSKNESNFSKKTLFGRFFFGARGTKSPFRGFFLKKTLKMTVSGFHKSGFVLSYFVML
jgi:hypothetical protein